MRAVMPTVPPDILDWRKRTGGDRYDEMHRFYAAPGVPEVWIVDRDSKQPQMHVLSDDDYNMQPALHDSRSLCRGVCETRRQKRKTGAFVPRPSRGAIRESLQRSPDTRHHNSNS